MRCHKVLRPGLHLYDLSATCCSCWGNSVCSRAQDEPDHSRPAPDTGENPETRLKALGLPLIDHGSHIVPVIVGDPVHTKVISDALLDEHGIYCQPINYPTVPRGTERLRFTPSPVHGPDELDKLVKAMDALWSHCALNRAELSA